MKFKPLKIMNFIKKLNAANIKIKGLKTDAFLINDTDLEKIKNIEIIDEKEYANDNQFCTLGKYKVESNKTLTNRRIMVEVNDLDLNIFKLEHVNVIQLNNEYDENELINKTQNINRVIIQAIFPVLEKHIAQCK